MKITGTTRVMTRNFVRLIIVEPADPTMNHTGRKQDR